MESSIETLKSQLQQLASLHASGALSKAEYESSTAALERRILDLVLSGAAAVAQSAAPHFAGATGAPSPADARPSRRLLAGVGAFVLVVAIGGYTWTGSPALFSSSPAGASAGAGQEGGGASHSVTAGQIAEMADKLAARLKTQPQDAQGWAMLARSYSVLGRNDEAVQAYATALAQQGDDAALLADYADALAVKNNRVLAGEPMRLVRRALELDPRNIKALALAGTDAFDRKDYAGAVKHWEKLLEFGPGDAAFAEQVKSSIAEARERGKLGAGPASAGAGTVAAAGANANPNLPKAQDKAQLAGAASVSGTVSLSPALAGKAGADDTVFIFARAADGSRIPLAVLRTRVRDLPMKFTLDDSLAMSPAAKISGAAQVIVSARISKTGEAMPSPGDLTGQVGPVALGASGLAVEIRDVVKP